MPSRAFSCSARSSPSYANRPDSASPAVSRFFRPIDCSPFEIPIEHGGGGELPDAECAADAPRRKDVHAFGRPEQQETRGPVVECHPRTGCDHIRTRGEDADAEKERPESRQQYDERG